MIPDGPFQVALHLVASLFEKVGVDPADERMRELQRLADAGAKMAVPPVMILTKGMEEMPAVLPPEVGQRDAMGNPVAYYVKPPLTVPPVNGHEKGGGL